MLYDFYKLLLSKKIEELYKKKRKLELLLGCNANSHHIRETVFMNSLWALD